MSTLSLPLQDRDVIDWPSAQETIFKTNLTKQSLKKKKKEEEEEVVTTKNYDENIEVVKVLIVREIKII